jgi:lipopolysaccharide assembly protein A
MTFLTWAIRLLIFAFLLVFAVQNTDTVVLHFVLGQQWQAPLVIVLLAFFAMGALLGALSLLGVIFRQRREISRLKHDLAKPPVPAISPPPVAP